MILSLYQDDNKNKIECIELLENSLNKELFKEEQLALLEQIKFIFGRRFPDVSRNSNGLNAWLNFIDVKCDWIQVEGSEWAKLIITEI